MSTVRVHSLCDGCRVGLIAVGLGAVTAEAVGAVYRAIPPGLEWYFVVLAAIGADHGVHLARTSVVSAAAETTLVASCLTAGRAALGLVCIALFSMVRLIVSAEDEGLRTLHTC